MQLSVSSSSDVPIVSIRADANGESVTPTDIHSAVDQFKSIGVQIRLSGHLKLSQNMELDGFTNLQIAGVGKAIIEQEHSFNDASPLVLSNCHSVYVSGLTLLGTGAPRTPGNPPQQNALRIVRSRYVWVERCTFGPLRGDGTIKLGVNIADDSHWVWVRANHFHRITGSAVIVGSGIWPHPTDSSAFEGHRCSNVHIDDNDFDEVGAAIAIDDATSLAWITRNRVRIHYGDAIAVQDGSTWFVVTENVCGPGRGSAVSVGHGQSAVWASRGIVSNNLAAGCNDGTLAQPPEFFGVAPRNSGFNRGDGQFVELCCNLDVWTFDNADD